MSACGNERGFTVVELVVALTILSLVLVTLASVFDTGRRMLSTAGRSAQELEEVAVLRRLLGHSFGQLTEAPGQVAALSGDDRRLTVFSPAPRVLAYAAPLLLNLSPSNDRQGLLASWSTNASDSAGSSPTARLVVRDRQVRFAYFSSDAGWTESWPISAKPPALVRVTIGREGGEEATTELVFETRLLALEACRPSPSKASCGAAR